MTLIVKNHLKNAIGGAYINDLDTNMKYLKICNSGRKPYHDPALGSAFKRSYGTKAKLQLPTASKIEERTFMECLFTQVRFLLVTSMQDCPTQLY